MDQGQKKSIQEQQQMHKNVQQQYQQQSSLKCGSFEQQNREAKLCNQNSIGLGCNELDRVPEQLIMQALSQYFMWPSSKSIPYIAYFTSNSNKQYNNCFWQINSLAYLFPYIRPASTNYNTNYNNNNNSNKSIGRLLCEHFVKLLLSDNEDEQVYNKQYGKKRVEAIKATVQSIVRGGNSNSRASCNRKLLLGRLISLPSTMPEYLTQYLAEHKGSHLTYREVEEQVVRQISYYAPQLTHEEQIFIVNKIVMIGYADTFFKAIIDCPFNYSRLQQVAKLYKYIVKKDTILLILIKLLLTLPTFQNEQIKQSKQQSQKYVLVANILHSIIQKQHLALIQGNTKGLNKQISVQPIVRVLSHSSLLPSQAKPIYDLVVKSHQLIAIPLMQGLLVWWVEGNDYYLTYNIVKYKTNLMVIIISHMAKQEVLKYSTQISLGIQRRLLVANANRKQVVELVWATLINKMELTNLGLQPHAFNTHLLKDDQSTQNNNQNYNASRNNDSKEKNDHKKIKGQLENKLAQQIKENIKQHKLEQMQSVSQQQMQQKQEQSIIKQRIELELKHPRNLYDCILGLRNPTRKSLTLKYLPLLIRKSPQDLIFSWRDLLTELLYNINRETQPSIVSLFVVRPQSFIESVSDVFFSKDNSLNDKIVIIDAICEGVDELATRPIENEEDKQPQQFYFKKVTSKYYKQNKNIKEPEELQKVQDKKSRRWGHTRIAYEQKLKDKSENAVSLKIVKNEPYINRLYQVSNQLYFRIVSKLALLPIFPNEPMFTNPMLRLLATLSYNLKNHIQKYKILVEIVQICLYVIQYIEKLNKSSNQNKGNTNQVKQSNLKKWKDTHIATLNTLNKISLVIDKFIPSRMLQLLQKCILKLKDSQQYGINPIISMIEANIYTNTSGNRVQY